MPIILCIETSTNVCSVSIGRDGETIFDKQENKGPSHAALLGVFVKDAMDFMREYEIELDAVAVSCGPGSYTGLRIGVSEAKGLCYGLNIPLIAINSLLVMASKISKTYSIEDTLLCPMIDARRMEVYAAIYDKDLHIVRDIQADIVDGQTYIEFLDKKKVYFFGNGAEKCKEIITHPNAVFIEDIYPLASDMITISENSFRKKDFVDVAYFEPFYLKEFIATIPKNKVI